MNKWMEGLRSFEHLSGHPDSRVGVKSRLNFKMGKREIEMIETVTMRNLPDELTGTYEAKGVAAILARLAYISRNFPILKNQF